MARRVAETPAAARAPLARQSHRPGRAGAEAIHTYLLDKIPQLAANLGRLPERIQAALFQAFDIQCLYKDDMNQVSIFATITTSTPQTVAAILANAGSDPASATPQSQPAPPGNPPIYPSAQPPMSGSATTIMNQPPSRPSPWVTARHARPGATLRVTRLGGIYSVAVTHEYAVA
jgi:hypothetical protein